MDNKQTVAKLNRLVIRYPELVEEITKTLEEEDVLVKTEKRLAKLTYKDMERDVCLLKKRTKR